MYRSYMYFFRSSRKESPLQKIFYSQITANNWRIHIMQNQSWNSFHRPIGNSPGIAKKIQKRVSPISIDFPVSLWSGQTCRGWSRILPAPTSWAPDKFRQRKIYQSPINALLYILPLPSRSCCKCCRMQFIRQNDSLLAFIVLFIIFFYMRRLSHTK